MFRHNEEIHSLVRSFENRTIAKSDWNHEAHLVVGLYYCHTLPFAVAKNIMRDGICWLNDTHGTPNTDSEGYHETLTVFWLKRIWNYLDEMGDCPPLFAIANEVVEKLNDPKLPLAYYSRERLYSAAARRDYLPPDRRLNHPLALTVSLLTLKPLF